jgi:hypothetical protein
MSTKTYRQIIEVAKKHLSTLVSFDASTIFFSDLINPTLFTVSPGSE